MRTFITFLAAAIAAFGCAQFKVDPQKTPVVQKKRRALIIGANNYQSLGKLAFASSDAERFRDALSKGFGFTNDSIRVISDSESSQAKPTASTILSELDTLLKDPVLDKGDLFILYFSGHGIATPKGDYLCSTDSTLANVETTGLPVIDLIDRLVKAKLRNVVIIADACRAGDKNDFGASLYDLAKKSNIAVLLGCSPGQKSYEVPQFRSGAFTYFLLKALGNTKNRTESGGLWTSRIAQNVEELVFGYTKHDYGDNAQRPKSFADPTSDVLLAKYVSKPEQRGLTTQNEDLKMVIDPEKVSDQMLEIGEELMQSNDYLGSLEACKQAISLNAGNMYAAYYASISTSYLGRSGEHEKYCEILKQSQEPFFHNLGVVQSDSRATQTSDRIKSLIAFWESSPKEEVYAMIAWGKARAYCPLEMTKVLLQRMMPELKDGTRVKAFFEAEIAVAEGKLEFGLNKLRACSKILEIKPLITDEQLTVMQFPLLRQLKRDEELKALMRAQFSTEQVSSTIWITVAANLKAMGNRDAAIAIIKKGIKEPNLTEQVVVLSGQLIGASLGEIAEDLETIQKANPYSWKIRTVTLIARAMKGQDTNAVAKAFDEASRYCDDELEIISLTYAIESSIFDDATKYFDVNVEKFAEPKELFRLMFFNKVDHFGTDSEKWYQLGELGMETLQGPATLRLFKQYLKDFNASSELGSEFYTILFQLAASVEDDQLVKFAVTHPAMTEPDRTDVQLLYSAYLVSRGDYVKARAAFATVGEVSEANKIVKQSLVAVLKARTGDVAGLKKFLDQDFSDSEGSLIAEGVAALALADLGKNDEALNHLARFTSYQPVMVSSVPLRCFERYLRFLKSKGKVLEAENALFEMLKVNQTSPAIMGAFFGSKPDIASFVGHSFADTRWVSDATFDVKNPTHKDEYQSAAIGQCQFEMTVGGDGSVKGTIKILDGETFDLIGKVDQFGNLRGRANSKLHKFDVEAKLISNDFKKSDVFKKSSIGQMINLFDEKGLVTHVMLPHSVLKP